MKLETQDKTQQVTKDQKKAKTETLNIDYYYNISLKEQKKKYRVSLRDYRKIVKTFLTIYFYELYFSKLPIYFIFGGFMNIVTYPSWAKMQKHGGSKKVKLHESEKAYGLFWHMVPTPKMYYMVKLLKLTGSTNMIPKIESVLTKNSNKDLIPIFTKEKKRRKQDKTLYQCIHNWYLSKA